MKKIQILKTSAVAITSVTLFPTTSQATVLALYDFEAAGAAAFDTSSSILDASAIIGGGTQNNSVPATNYFNGTRGGQHANALPTAGETDSITFTTVGLSGEDVTYENLSSFFGSNGGFFTPSLSYMIGAASSVDAGTGSEPALQTFAQQTFDFADFTTDETVTWTLLFTKGTGGNDRLRIDDLTLNGSVVPEPSSTALLGLGSLALILRRRK